MSENVLEPQTTALKLLYNVYFTLVMYCCTKKDKSARKTPMQHQRSGTFMEAGGSTSYAPPVVKLRKLSALALALHSSTHQWE